MNSYSHLSWVQFREEVIKLDGGRCVQCCRSRADNVVLQVHHKAYVAGRKPWEYGHEECETLCKGCHAEEHGIIMPQSGWELVGSDDLGDLIGNCELCSTDLRYTYAITHPNWGAMAVGINCCDKLTATTAASDHHDKMMKARDARARFLSSARWQEHSGGILSIVQKGIRVRITTKNDGFHIFMNSVPGKVEYGSLIDAKLMVYDTIKSGAALEFLEKRRRRASLEMAKLAATPLYIGRI